MRRVDETVVVEAVLPPEVGVEGFVEPSDRDGTQAVAAEHAEEHEVGGGGSSGGDSPGEPEAHGFDLTRGGLEAVGKVPDDDRSLIPRNVE